LFIFVQLIFQNFASTNQNYKSIPRLASHFFKPFILYDTTARNLRNLRAQQTSMTSALWDHHHTLQKRRNYR